jgi:predicted RNase H-like nuclease (RuvC/YqgF family)
MGDKSDLQTLITELDVYTGAASVTATPAPAATTLEARRRLLAEEVRDRAQAEAETREADHRIGSLSAELVNLRARVSEMEAEVATLDRHRLAASLTYDRRARARAAGLAHGASERIKQFRRQVLNDLDDLRRRTTLTRGATAAPRGGYLLELFESWGLRNPLTDKREHLVDSNMASIEARRQALVAALAAVDALSLEALDDEAVVVKLVALKRAIPNVEPVAEDRKRRHQPDLLTRAEQREVEQRMQEAR